MINSTFLSLSAVLLIGSPFSISPISQYKTLSFEKCLFKRTLHTLFYINFFQNKLNISSTTFNEIIGGVIRFDSEHDVQNQTIQIRYHPNIMQSNNYSFIYCKFRDIKTVGETSNGGAICLFVPFTTDYNVRLSISFSEFYNCYTAGGQGGAIFCQKTSNVTIIGTSFKKCSTREPTSTGDTGSGTAIYIYSSSGTFSSSRSSFTECPTTTIMNPNTESVVFALTDTLAFDHANFSNNHLEAGASSVCLIEQSSARFSNCVMKNLSSEATLQAASQGDLALLRLAFVNCSSKMGHVYARTIICIFYAFPTVEDTVFVMGDFRNLVSRDITDTNSKITFSKCTFDLALEEMADLSCAAFTDDCSFGVVNPTFPNDPTTQHVPTRDVVTATEEPDEAAAAKKKVKSLTIAFSVVGSLLAVAVVVLAAKIIFDKKKGGDFDRSATLNEDPLLR